MHDDLQMSPFGDPQVENRAHETDNQRPENRGPETFHDEPFHEPRHYVEQERIHQDHKQTKSHDDQRQREEVENGSDDGIQDGQNEHGCKAGGKRPCFDPGHHRGGQKNGYSRDSKSDEQAVHSWGTVKPLSWADWTVVHV